VIEYVLFYFNGQDLALNAAAQYECGRRSTHFALFGPRSDKESAYIFKAAALLLGS
jgi:hypothetical protein